MLNPLRKRLLKPAEQMLQHLVVSEPVKDLRLLPDQLFFNYDEIEQTSNNHRKAGTLPVSSSFEVMFKFF